MSGIKEYILTIVAASVIAAIVMSITEKTSENKRVMELITGLFLLLTLLSPLKGRISFNFLPDIENIERTAEESIAVGKADTHSQLKEIITEQVASYIEDKATTLGADLKVTVTVSPDDPPVPTAVKLEGSISPYAKSKLIDIIANDVGVSEDHQTWK